VEERLEGSLIAGLMAVINGAQILRVHDVKETRQMLDLVQAINNYQ
jgi:dihydropteroate synthase